MHGGVRVGGDGLAHLDGRAADMLRFLRIRNLAVIVVGHQGVCQPHKGGGYLPAVDRLCSIPKLVALAFKYQGCSTSRPPAVARAITDTRLMSGCRRWIRRSRRDVSRIGGT